MPPAPAHDRLLRLRSARTALEQQYFEAIEARREVQKHLLALREGFSTNVVKSMLRCAPTWLNTVPTDPVAGLAAYSDVPAAVALPGTVLGWRDAAGEDAALLGDQVRALREAERAERELAAFVQATTEARRAIFERMREWREDRVEPVHARLLDAAR